MHLSNALLDAVTLFHDDFEWVQSIDYEHVPFHCRKCHSLGHLFRDCPSSLKTSAPTSSDKSDLDCFTSVTNHRKNPKKSVPNPKTPVANPSMPSTRNNFETLAQPKLDTFGTRAPSEEQPKSNVQSSSTSSKKTQKSKQTIDLTSPSPSVIPAWNPQGMDVDNAQCTSKHATETTEERSEFQHMEEEPESIDIGDLDILGLEQACKTNNYDNIPERQLENLEVILSRAQQQRTLRIQLVSQWDGRNLTKDNKKRGRKTDLQ